MLMTTWRLIGLRLFNMTVGQSALGNKILRKIMVQILIKKKGQKTKYMASSRFFQFSDLD